MKDLIHRSRKSFTVAQPADSDVPENVWVKCPACRELIYHKQLAERMKVCKCGYHMRLTAREWLVLLDEGSFTEHDANLRPTDPLGFVSPKEAYADKLRDSQRRTGLSDVVVSGVGAIEGHRVSVAVCDFGFIGGSMGSVFGEKMARAAERAADLGVPLLTINTSGGARMQEGVIALMQLAKVNMALTRLAAARQPHIAVLVDPCYGGVTASYASVADIIIAEPGANIGFAGRRVIEQTIRQKLPADFQTSEFMLQHGMIDMVIPRGDLHSMLAKLMRLYAARGRTAHSASVPAETALSSI
ncbi:MAG: acetyl-CoA carboxylase carboxyltransferase subunit beta [Chloroflexi bacterium]|nr:acetyl-CoA carboxylase carboxyltransferase subunit beta [Chloroflexota bacterium]